tara:strand:- start:247 stop:492 length:246 start_codon:yes stop_codon:yes gene_type:complete
MNQIGHINGKFKNLNSSELLEVANFYIEENKYNSTPQYIDFNKWYEDENKSGEFKKNDVIKYFQDHFFDISTLKEFYKYWK